MGVNVSITQRLVDGLEEVGRSLYLQVFTAPNGIALLDWVPDHHQVLTVWVHDEGADLRVGTSIHTVIPLTDLDQVDELVDAVRRALTEGAWHETFVLDPTSGEVDPLTWRLGTGPGAPHSRAGMARPPADGVRVRRQGTPWGPTGQVV